MSATWTLFQRWMVLKNFPSERQAVLALGAHPSSVTWWKKGQNAGADVIERMAEDLGENPAAWAALAMKEQSKGETARAWARIARQLGAAACLIIVMGNVVGRDGFEPSTSGLKVRCSTD